MLNSAIICRLHSKWKETLNLFRISENEAFFPSKFRDSGIPTVGVILPRSYNDSGFLRRLPLTSCQYTYNSGIGLTTTGPKGEHPAFCGYKEAPTALTSDSLGLRRRLWPLSLLSLPDIDFELL